MKRPSNPLALAVLTLLSEKPMHPYEMSTTLRQRSKEESIKLNFGSLYAVVDSLRKKGLVNARETVREGRRPERTVYELTDPGEQAMRQWLCEMLRDPTPQFTDFEAALSLAGALEPDVVLDMLRQRLQGLVTESKRYDGLRSAMPETFPEIFLIEGDFAEAMRRAETAFVRGLVERIDTGSLGGLALWRRLHELRDAGVTGDDAQARLAEEFGAFTEWEK